MEKTIKKKLLAIIAAGMFIGMMGMSVTTSTQGTDISMTGIELIAYGSSSGCQYECGDCPTGMICDPGPGNCCLHVCDGTCSDCFSSDCTGGIYYCGKISNGTECHKDSP